MQIGSTQRMCPTMMLPLDLILQIISFTTLDQTLIVDAVTGMLHTRTVHGPKKNGVRTMTPATWMHNPTMNGLSH